MEVVVNEWFLHFLSPNTINARLWVRFYSGVERGIFKIVVRRSGKFFLKLSKSADQYPNNFKFLFEIFADSLKTTLVTEDEIIPLPDSIREATPADDFYLIELAYSTRDRIIVTTDSRLKDALSTIEEIKVYLLEEFLEAYSL